MIIIIIIILESMNFKLLFIITVVNFIFVIESIKAEYINEYENHGNKEDKELTRHDDDIKCNISDLSECATMLLVSTSANQCSDNGKCKSSIMKTHDHCISEIYKDFQEKFNMFSENIINLAFYTPFKKIGIAFSFACDKVGEEWCYDKYITALEKEDFEEMNKFYCGECGNIALSKYKLIYENLSIENNTIYYNLTRDEINKIESICINGFNESNNIQWNAVVITATIYLIYILLEPL